MEESIPTNYKTSLLDLSAFEQPLKLVTSEENIYKWLRSEAYYDVLGFITWISEAVQGIKCNDTYFISKTMKGFLAVFDKLHSMVDRTPANEQNEHPYGNRAYRSWASKMDNEIHRMLKVIVPESKCHIVNELGCYLCESFGSSIRIDYGTGHELSFIFFMCSLFKADILHEEDKVACALSLFNNYLQFVRRLQKTYKLQFVGSQGVWSLDDYQFLPFIWGSAQLSMNSPFKPEAFLNDDIIEMYKTDYIFIGCIDFIKQMKQGHFAEHSHQLWVITAVKSWSKLNEGLFTMYQREILSKYSIIQHVYFGKLMSFNTVKPGTVVPNARLGHKDGATPAGSMQSQSKTSEDIEVQQNVAEYESDEE